MTRALWVPAVALSVITAWLAVYHPGFAVGVAGAGLALLAAPALKWLRLDIARPLSAPPAPELVAIPILIEGRLFIGAVGAVVVLAGLLVYLATMPATRPRPPAAVIAGAAIMFALPFSRPLDDPLLPAALIPALCIAVLVLSAQRRDLHAAASSLADGVGLYLVVNTVAHLAGVVSPAASGRTGALEAANGGTRVIFPMATSLATPAVLAALYVAAAVLCFERCSRPRRLFRVFALGAAGYVLLAADTRMAMAVGVIVLVVSVTSGRFLARAAVPLVAVSAAFAFVFDAIQATVAAAISSVLSVIPQLSRGDLQGDLTLSFRSEIWKRTMGFWATGTDFPGQWLGYGLRGQEQSGASRLYAQALGGFLTNPQAASVHNSYMQQLFDAGLIGLVVFVAVLIWAARRCASLWRARVPGAQLALPILLAAAATGITEVTLSPGYAQAPVFIVVGLAIFAGTSHPQAQTAASADEDRLRSQGRVSLRGGKGRASRAYRT